SMLAGTLDGYSIEKRYVHKSGRIVHAALHVSMVHDETGRPAYFVAQVEDITQRKEVERLKNEFISTVSHELRTPLTSIRGSLGLLVSGAFGDLPGKVTSLVRIAHSNCERLIRIINDILDVEKIESGALELHSADVQVAPLLARALE